ncbi:hypothetical protein C9374_010095 [Naegleria lovaniensis]|uniref:Actin n=1 Tax=Naegleria lovaniensis TaxID=51637 RepID=A0AA88GJ36_NAELO|nr:uncharacterized protein C9374_010095 [Naegleria lovaniensis]KAG2375091.1 hypothetical protein C9374_010095 [Naegleria lovaniensis]
MKRRNVFIDQDLMMLSNAMEFRPLVIDQGTGMMKAGFSGDDMPLLLMPTVMAADDPIVDPNSSKFVGHRGAQPNSTSNLHSKMHQQQDRSSSSEKTPEVQVVQNNEDELSYLIGDEALGVDRSSGAISRSAKYFSFNANNEKNYREKRDSRITNTLITPMERGVVDDWDMMERMYEAIYSHPKINMTPENQPLLISEACENPKENRYHMAEILFEKYKVPSLFIATQPVLSLYSTGKSSGLVVEIGHGVSQMVPIFEGFPLYHAIVKSEFGGQDLTNYLRQILEKNRRYDQLINYGTIGGLKTITEIKEKLCYVSQNIAEEQYNVGVSEYVLPDRKVIQISHEAYKCPEALFYPKLAGKPSIFGVHEALYHVYDKSDDYVKQILMDNIVLAGGSTMFSGFKQRLVSEFSRVLVEKTGSSKITERSVRAENDRIFGAWIGGSILASLPTFQQLWITRQDYDDHHDAIFSRCYS